MVVYIMHAPALSPPPSTRLALPLSHQTRPAAHTLPRQFPAVPVKKFLQNKIPALYCSL